jgi:hypothetical protein
MRMIVTAARSVAAPRRVILRCSPGIAAKFSLFGMTDIDGVSLVTVDDR